MLRVTFYTKPNCSLCDEALEQVETARKEVAFEMVSVNILNDPEIYLRHRYNIPVICIGDDEAFRYRVTSEELVARIRECERGLGV